MKECEEQVINIFIDNSQINTIRKKFNPNFKNTKAHITLVYPFQISSQKELLNHINSSIKRVKKFNITLEGFQKSSKDYYLYLLIKEGKKEIISLYKQLNSGILKDFKNKDMPRFIPHISLGMFNSEKEINHALNELKKQKVSIKSQIKEINLLTLNKDHSIKSIKKFKLI